MEKNIFEIKLYFTEFLTKREEDNSALVMDNPL